MNADKRKALEAAGWKFGSADEFLCERRMSDSDKMRAEFESWAESKCMSLTKINWKCGSVSEYAYTATFDAWQVWQAAYQAGRMAVQREKEEWSKRVNKRWIEMENKPEGER